MAGLHNRREYIVVENQRCPAMESDCLRSVINNEGIFGTKSMPFSSSRPSLIWNKAFNARLINMMVLKWLDCLCDSGATLQAYHKQY